MSRASADGRATERRQRRWWPIFVGCAAVAIGVSLATPAGRHQWALSTIRQPAHYTVLYFDDAANLPGSFVWHAATSFSFTIINDEGRPSRYEYVIRSSDGVYSAVVGRSHVSIAPGASFTVSTVIYPTCRLTPCRIRVTLPGHPEVIDFIVNVHYRKAKAASTRIAPIIHG
jgi:hypothetical protein